jgi:hypothetical protein
VVEDATVLNIRHEDGVCDLPMHDETNGEGRV